MADPPPSSTIVMPAQGVFVFASEALGALKTSPVLLLIVVLNLVFASLAGYYLLQVEHYRADDRAAIGNLLADCINRSVPVDYLLHIEAPSLRERQAPVRP